VESVHGTRAASKFDRLVASRVDDVLAREIKDAVLSLENIQARDLTRLLGNVNVGHLMSV